MKPIETIVEFEHDIHLGEYDDHLDRIQAALTERRGRLNYRTLMSIKVGDRVRVKSGRPHYIVGAKATVTKVKNTRVDIDLDQPCGRYYKNINCPISILEVLQGEEIIP